MFSEIKIFSAAFVVFVVLVMGAGCLLSDNMADTDLFNPQRHGAEAEDMLADTEWENQIRELAKPDLKEELRAVHDLRMEQYEAKREILKNQTDQTILQIEQNAKNNIEHQKEMNHLEEMEKRQKIEHREQLAQAGILILKVFGIVMAIAMGGGVMILMVRKILKDESMALAAPRAEEPAKPFIQNWENSGHRQNRIYQARRMEREIRKLQLDGRQPDSARREIYPWRT